MAGQRSAEQVLFHHVWPTANEVITDKYWEVIEFAELCLGVCDLGVFVFICPHIDR